MSRRAHSTEVAGPRMSMTREYIIAFAEKKFGERWVSRLAKAIGYSTSAVSRMAAGEAPVTRRMELEVERLVREHRFEALAKPECDIREQKKEFKHHD